MPSESVKEEKRMNEQSRKNVNVLRKMCVSVLCSSIGIIEFSNIFWIDAQYYFLRANKQKLGTKCNQQRCRFFLSNFIELAILHREHTNFQCISFVFFLLSLIFLNSLITNSMWCHFEFCFKMNFVLTFFNKCSLIPCNLCLFKIRALMEMKMF